MAVCRGEAITLHGCTDQQLLNQLAALLRPVVVAVEHYGTRRLQE